MKVPPYEEVRNVAAHAVPCCGKDHLQLLGSLRGRATALIEQFERGIGGDDEHAALMTIVEIDDVIEYLGRDEDLRGHELTSDLRKAVVKYASTSSRPSRIPRLRPGDRAPLGRTGRLSAPDITWRACLRWLSG